MPSLPGESNSRLYSEEKCRIFHAPKVLEVVEETKARLKRPLTLGDAITTVARLGGYLARPSDPPPGSKVLWRGFIRLVGMVDGFLLRATMANGP